MKVIIDAYRGGNDTGKLIDDQYEKNLLLNLSKYMSNELTKLGISNELVRNNDVSLTDEERNSIINELKNTNDIIIQNRLSEDNEFDLIYPLRKSDALTSLISSELESNGINVDKYYQRRLPTNTTLDYYSVIRNTNPNETIIIEYLDVKNYENVVDSIVASINKYIQKHTTYTVQKEDSLYKIATKYNTNVDTIKKLNNLTSNNLSIGQVLKIPQQDASSSVKQNIYTVKKGDSLYKIATTYNTTVEILKKINNLSSNTLNIGQILTIPSTQETKPEETTAYTVQKGDSLYKIANQYNTNVATLKKINNLSSNTLNIGQILYVPSTEDNYITYTVKKGDSLYKIATYYNTTVKEIKSINNLTNNILSIGQVLKIPR